MTSASDGSVLTSLDEGVLTVTINRAVRANALSRALRAELTEIWQRYCDDRAVRCVVIGAVGAVFSAGADVKELQAEGRLTGEAGFVASTHYLPCRWMQVPVIVSVGGPCVGLALDLVADADLVVASRDATFVDPHVSVGVASPLTLLFLSAKLSPAILAKMALLGTAVTLGAEDAHRWGLVAGLAEPGQHDLVVAEWARTIAAASPAAVRLTVTQLRSLTSEVVDARLRDAWDATALGWQHPDVDEGLAALLEHRTPNWKLT